MRLTLTGEVEDKGGLNIELAARFENKTGKDLNLMAEGSVNGMKMTPTFVKKSNTESGKTSDCAIQISYNDFDLSRYTDIRQMQLSFKVQEIKTEVSSSSSSSSSSSGKNSHASASASASSSVTSVVGVYKNIGQVDVRFTDHVEIEGDRYFEEQPALAHPSNYVSVKVTGSSTSSSNGKMNSATYTFAPKDSGKKAADLLKTYLDELKKQGLTVTGSGGEYVVSNNGIPIARIALDGGNFVVTLIP